MARVRTVPDRREAPRQKEEERRKREAVDKPSTSSDKKSHKSGHDELKHLQDSLSSFFTPTTGRRCRYPPKKFDDELPEEEKPKKEMLKPLSIDVSCSHSKAGQNSKGSNGISPAARSGDVSPARKVCERLMDSLSPYFTVSSERRRNGHSSRDDGSRRQSESAAGSSPIAPLSPNDSSPKKMSQRRRGDELKKVVGGRNTQNSASAALFGSPMDETTRSSSEGDCPPHKKGRSPMKPKKVIKEEKDDEYPEEKVSATAPCMKEKKKKKSIAASSSAQSPSCSASGEKENLASSGTSGPCIQITESGRSRFVKAQQKTQLAIDDAIKQFASQVDPSNPTKDPHWPLAIRIGRHEIKTWYSAPFPQEYADTPMLYICQFCLKYMKSAQVLAHHRKKCMFHHPPGNEIYRKGNVSVFEVDGNMSRIYCQNLCLIAKLFLDHKTLYYDVEPFLFYVVTTNDDTGFHFVGYFSKEKYSTQKFNLSCIVTLPSYQKMGFGRFLIDFSFLLSRKEGLLGTPERPLSDLGRISYASYWRTAIFEWIHANVDRTKSFKLPAISEGTGIAITDVVEVFDNLEWFQKTPAGVKLEMNWSMIDAQAKRAKSDKSRISIDPDALRWTPTQYTPSKDFGVRSPVRLSTPHRSPTTTANVGSTPTGVSIAAVGSTVKKGCGPPRSSKKSAARRKLTLSARKEPPPPTSSSADDSDTDLPRSKTACREPQPRRRLRHDSSPDPDQSESDKKPKKESRNGVDLRQATTPGGIGSRRKASSRGKAVYEGDRSRSPSSSLSSSEDDKDESFSLGGRHGKKPQKGSKGTTVPRRRRAPPKKAGKGPGKSIPPNPVTRDSSPDMSPPPRCDSAATSATVPMRQGAEGCGTPGGGRTLNDVEDEPVPATPPPCEPLPSASPQLPSHRASRNSNRPLDPRSTTASSANNSELSDESRPHSPTTPSNCSTPRPVGGHEHHIFMNMGGVPDDDAASRSGAMSVESDQPPQLHAVGGTSSDEAPPLLPPEEQNPPVLSAVGGYNTDEDDAPPQLSPVIKTQHERSTPPMEEPVLTEEQRQQIAMDQPPKAPVMMNKLDEEEHMFDHSSIMEPHSSKSLMMNQVSTPQNTYPGSLKQTTPASVPQCQMNQVTPEMPFLSPSMQAMQPTSVSSVHSMQNTSMEMPSGSVPQPFPSLSAAPQSDPSTPLRSVHTSMPSSFGSPPAVQSQQMRPSIDAVPSTSNSRRSSDGSRQKRNQSQPLQQQPQQQPQQQQPIVAPQFSGHHYPMQLNPYMQPQYQTGYPTNYPFDPTGFQANQAYWQAGAYAQHYGKSGSAMGNMMPQAMMYPTYPNGMVQAATAAQQAYATRYPNPGGSFSATPNGFPGFYPNQFYPFK